MLQVSKTAFAITPLLHFVDGLARRWPSATFLLAPAPNKTFVQSNKDVYYIQGITISLINNFC